MNGIKSIILTAAVTLACAGPAGAGWPGEWTLYSSYSSGDYGTAIDSDTRAMALRYRVGDDWRFQVELPFLETEFSYGLVNTGVGMVPLGPEGESARRQGGGGGNGGTGSGPGGSGVSAAVLPQLVEYENTTGAGDVRLELSRKLSGGGVKLHRLEAGLEVKIPTADEEEGLGTGEADYRLGLSWDYRFWSARAFAGGGWNRLGDPWWGEFNDVLDLYAGIEGDPVLGERLVFAGWVSGHQETVDGTGERTAAGLGLWTTGKVRWHVQIAAGLSDAAPDVAAQVGLSFGSVSPGALRWRGRP